jgi:hypothetical protein
VLIAYLADRLESLVEWAKARSSKSAVADFDTFLVPKSDKPDFGAPCPPYALHIVVHKNKPWPNSLITGKITGNFLKFSPGCDIKIFSIY